MFPPTTPGLGYNPSPGIGGWGPAKRPGIARCSSPAGTGTALPLGALHARGPDAAGQPLAGPRSAEEPDGAVQCESAHFLSRRGVKSRKATKAGVNRSVPLRNLIYLSLMTHTEERNRI